VVRGTPIESAGASKREASAREAAVNRLRAAVAAVRLVTTFPTPAVGVVRLVFLVFDSVFGVWARTEADASPPAVEKGQPVPVVVVAFDQCHWPHCLMRVAGATPGDVRSWRR